MQNTRRDALKAALAAGMGLGLRSLATGLPPIFFGNPRRALAMEQQRLASSAAVPQFLILSTSQSGDPLNANVPGCYLDPNIAHPSQPSMAPTSMKLGSASYMAAAPWATLPTAALARTMFMHHGTTTVVHSDEGRVLRLMGAVKDNDNLLSFIGKQLQPKLGCVQGAPIVLGASGAGEYVPYQGRPQAPMAPTALAAVLGNPAGPLRDLQATRDQALDELFDWFKASGNEAQVPVIDRYATSREQVRDINQTFITQLTALTDNTADSQLNAALILAQMQMAPVFTVHLSFGGDNHGDPSLNNEANSHVSALKSINKFLTRLQATNLKDRITFASMNVFGRTLNRASSLNGRDHLAQHHVTFAIGSNVRGGVYGAVAPSGRDYAALPIDSKSGQASTSGDITPNSGLASAGRTLAAAVGIDAATLDTNIPTGKTLQAALVAS